jgi:hypothetical protein
MLLFTYKKQLSGGKEMDKLMGIIEILNCFEHDNKADIYSLLEAYTALGLSDSEKGFILFYMGYFDTL